MAGFSYTPAALFRLFLPGRRSLSADIHSLAIWIEVVVLRRLSKLQEVLDEAGESTDHARAQTVDARVRVDTGRHQTRSRETIQVLRDCLAADTMLRLHGVGKLTR